MSQNPFIENNDQPKPKRSINENEQNDQELNDSIFKDDNIPTDSEEFKKEITDYSDPLKRKARKNTISKILLGTIIVILLALLGLLIFQLTKPTPQKTPQPTPTPTATETNINTTPEKEAEKINPILKAYPEAPKVITSEITVDAENDTAKATNNTTLTIPNSTIKTGTTKCKLVDPTDFCLVGAITKSETNGNIFFMKDAAHSKMFENPESFKQIEVKGSKVAGIIPVDLGEEGVPTLIIVQPDSSGWLIVLDNPTNENLEKLAQTITTTTK